MVHFNFFWTWLTDYSLLDSVGNFILVEVFSKHSQLFLWINFCQFLPPSSWVFQSNFLSFFRWSDANLTACPSWLSRVRQLSFPFPWQLHFHWQLESYPLLDCLLSFYSVPCSLFIGSRIKRQYMDLGMKPFHRYRSEWNKNTPCHRYLWAFQWKFLPKITSYKRPFWKCWHLHLMATTAGKVTCQFLHNVTNFGPRRTCIEDLNDLFAQYSGYEDVPD